MNRMWREARLVRAPPQVQQALEALEALPFVVPGALVVALEAQLLVELEAVALVVVVAAAETHVQPCLAWEERQLGPIAVLEVRPFLVLEAPEEPLFALEAAGRILVLHGVEAQPFLVTVPFLARLAYPPAGYAPPPACPP